MKQLPFGPYKIQHSGIHDIIHQCGCISEIPRIFFWIHEPRKCHQQQNTWWKLDNADQDSTATAFSQSTTEAFCHPGAPSRIWIGRGACLGWHKVSRLTLSFWMPRLIQGQLAKTLADEKESNAFRMAWKKNTNGQLIDQWSTPPKPQSPLACTYLSYFPVKNHSGVAHNPMNSWGATSKKSRSNGEWAKEGVVQVQLG